MNKKFLFTLHLVLTIALALPAGAASPELNGAASADKMIVVTPKNLDLFLFGKNTDIARAMNQVLRAKDQVNAARADLIPSLNLNFITTIANPPAFLVNFASCLVPFLFPSKWYALNAADKSYSADVTGLEITRLNTYSVAYALLVRVKGDEEVLELITQTMANVDEYVTGLEVQSKIGLMPHAEVLRGIIERGRLSSDLIRIGEAIADEHAALRKMLGFNIDQKFSISVEDEMPSRYEDLPANSPLLEKMVNRAPERVQLEFLHDAAQAGVGAARWAFLGGCSGNTGTVGLGTGSSQSVFSISTSASINIGFGYFPAISIAKRNVSDVEIRQQELSRELARALESVLADISGEKARMTIGNTSVAASESLLQEQNYLLELGKISVKERLDALTGLARAKTEALSAHSTLMGHRITLKRLALEGKFLKVYIQSNRDLELGTNGSPRRGD